MEDHRFGQSVFVPVIAQGRIVDIPLQEREFYDREKDEEEGVLMDMDLIYPHGYGEAISGGESLT